jgi:hypothetical protein
VSLSNIAALAQVASLLVAGLAVFLALRGVRNQLWLQMFSEYTRRYGEIVKSLPSESRRPDGDFAFDRLDEAKREEVENTVRAYLNLCAEEYYLHERGQVDDETWKIWRKGMVETFRLPWLRQTWPRLAPEWGFYPEFRTFAEECIKERPSHAEAAA